MEIGKKSSRYYNNQISLGLLIIILFCLLEVHVSKAAIYVSQSGSDDNYGTKTSPFKSIQKAIETARSGNKIYIKSGTYSLNGYSKILKKHINLIGEGKKSTIIKGGGSLTFSCGFTVKGLKFTGFREPPFKLATELDEIIDGVLIENCIFEKMSFAIDNRRVGRGKTTNITIRNNDFLDMDGGGVTAIRLMDGSISNIVIANNKFKNLSSLKKYCIAIFIGKNANQDTTKNVKITGNYFENIAGPTAVIDGAGSEVHAVLGYGSNFNISYNAVKNMNPGTDHEAIYVKADNSLISNNVMIDCTSNQGAIAIKGQKSHHNVIENNKVLSKQTGVGIYVAGGRHVAIKDNFVKLSENSNNGIGIYIYEINDTPAIVTGNYVESGKHALYMRGSKDSIISGNTFFSIVGKTMNIGRRKYSFLGQDYPDNIANDKQPQYPPVAMVKVDQERGNIPFEVAFSSAGSSDTNGQICLYKWDFHDGTTSLERNPSHIFRKSRTHVVTLRVSDNEGNQDLVPVTIEAY